MAARAAQSTKGDRSFRPGKAALLFLAGLLIVPIVFFEAASQLPDGAPSPIQVPLLTTPATIQLVKKDREKVLRGEMPRAQLDHLVANAAKRLTSEPLDSGALWLWSIGQNTAQGREALELAEAISLREPTVQLQLMRQKALSGDLPESLAHLNNALLVSPSSAPPILQALAKGLNEPQLVKLLQPYASRPWYKQLLEQSVYYAPQPANAADLLLQTKLAPEKLPPRLVRNLLERLIMAGNFDSAAAVAKGFGGMTKAAFTDFTPKIETMVPESVPLTWQLSDDANIMAEPISRGVFFEIERGLGGTLMARITNYRPGTYTLREVIEASTPDLEIRWELQCLQQDAFRKAWEQPIPAVTQKQTFDTQVTISADCKIQRWQLASFNQAGGGRATLSVTQLDLLQR
jgi:hypothetical protein